MPETSTASSSPSKPSPLPQTPAMTEPSISQQNLCQLKESLMLQLDEQRMLHEKLEQQRNLILKNRSNNLSGAPDFQGLQRNIPVPRPDEMRRNYNVNKFIMRHHQQQQKSEIGGINSTHQMQMVQSKQPMVQRLQQKTGSHNLISQFRANGTLNVQDRVTPAQLRQDALAATQAQNAPTSGLTQNGQPGVVQNATSPQTWFKKMQVIDPIYSSSQRKLQPQQQSQRMEGPADQKPVFLTGSQPDEATPGGSSRNGTEENDQFIRKKMIHDVVSQLDLNGNLDPKVEELLVKIAGYAIDTVTALARSSAKHPKSSTTDSTDELLHPGGSKQENSKSSVRDFSVRKPQAVCCHCGLEATTHTSNQGSRFWCCNKVGAERCGFFERCEPETCSGCIETLAGMLRKMDAKDATIKDLKIRYRELNMASLVCVLVMQLMLLYRLVIG